MTRRAGRLALFLALAAALATAGWIILDLERGATEDRAAILAFDQSVDRALWAVADARAGLEAYVATGQGNEFWRRRVAEATRVLKQELGTLKQLASEGTALNDLDAASAAFESLTSVEERAAQLVHNDQRSVAARLIFGEGLEATSVAASRINAAGWAERQARDARLATARARSAYAAAAAAGAALVVALLLLPVPRRAAASPASAPAEPLVEPSPSVAPVSSAVAPAQAPAPATAAAEAADSGGPMRDRRKATELKAMADLCTDFTRLVDSQELPGLLERAARLIDATGFVVWMVDASGQQLRPALAHGYSAQALARLPPIGRDADNATAAAWRHAEMQVVQTNGMSPGAIVLPLLSAMGCVGVLAAEIRHGRESSESVRAFARIVAAQVAALVSPPAVEATGATGADLHEQAHG